MGETRPPVSQSPLYQNGRSLLPGRLSARRGLVSAVADPERRPDEAKVLHNMQQHRKRYVWTSRGTGYTHDNTTALNSGGKILDFATFIDTSAVTTLLVQAGSKVQSYSFGTHSGTDITGLTGLSTSKRPCMRIFSPSTTIAQPITVYCNGDIEPRRITATNTSSALLFNSPGAWPGTFLTLQYSKPKFCEPFGDRMAYAGFTDAATQFDILISNLGDAQAFTQGTPVVATDATAFTAPAELGAITGIKSFRPSNLSNEQIFLIGQERGVSMISGTNATDYRLDILTNQYGIVNNRCWADVTDDLIFLTTKGVANLGALIQNLTQPSDMLSKDINDKIQNIDFTNAGDAFCVHHPITQEVQFWVPWTQDAGVNTRGLILCYNTDGSVRQPVWSTKDGFTPSSGIEFKGVMYCGSYDGFIQQHYNGDMFNGNQILFQIVHSLATVGNVNQAGRMQRITVITDGRAQKFSINVYAYTRMADGTTGKVVCTPAAYTLQDAVGSETVLPFTLGNSSFPGDFMKTHNFSPVGRGFAFEIELLAGNSADNYLDYSSCEFTLSIGGIVRL